MNRFYDFSALLIAIYFTIVSHEIAHGLVAYINGDSTAKDAGRLTLNPIAHIDPIGLACLIFFRFGWAKPVPINPYRFQNMRSGIISTSLAGVLMNLLTAFLAVYLQLLIPFKYQWMHLLLQYLTIYGVFFCLFNLIPIPPLDGSKVLAALLPDKLAKVYLKSEEYSRWLLPILAVSGLLGAFLTPAAKRLIEGIYLFVMG